MKTYKIVSVLESFEFPLHEATRKQVWWTAKKKQKEGNNVEILILSKINKSIEHENIKITYSSKWFLSMFLKADRIHFITGSISVWLLLVVFCFGEKNLTLTDGDMFGYNKKWLRKQIVKVLPFIYNKIIVFSNFQKNRLKLNSVEVKFPLLPIIDVNPIFKRRKKPTLLYMGHLSYFKGVDTIIKSFKDLITDIPNLTLIIANNSIRGDQELILEVENLKQKYPNNIELKGIVDPIEELSKTWIYLYPFKEAIGTMSFALSLYEAEKCNTPYIACDVGANSEFFNKDYLIPVNDDKLMTLKIKKIINERKNK